MSEYHDEYLEEGAEDWDEEALEEQQVNAVPVKVIATNSERVSPQFASCMTFAVPQAGVANGTTPTYVQVLQRRQNRYKAKFGLSLGTGATAIVVNSRPDALTLPNPQGATWTTVIPEWDSQQPLYAVAIGGPATLTVVDETYGQQQ